MPRATANLRAIHPPGRGAARAAKKQVPRTAAQADDASLQTTTRRIAESITAAIVERRLMPGTKLAEQKIADIFKVSRTIVRQALHQLSRDKLVTLEQARGARVAQPSVEEA
ncbi:MAG: GntR family transcriptional regulator, partial [Cytophagales bacterium]|nr:GntR family transcriptional regulator [Rhizobacter sp.]